MDFTGLLVYRTSYMLRQALERLLGHCYDPIRDIAIVTGGCSGVGKQIVQQLRSMGGTVVVLDIERVTRPEQVEGAFYYQCDVSNVQQILECRKAIIRDVGVPTVLINNAAMAIGKEILDMSYAEIEKTISVNLSSSFYTTKLFLPDMIRMHRGYVITISLVMGYISPALFGVYGASKAGLVAFHESLTYELGLPLSGKSGIKTLLMCPGQIKTNMFNGVETPLDILAPKLEPEMVAETLIHALRLGRRGEIKLPFYSRIMPVFRAIPWPFSEGMRRWLGIDDSARMFLPPDQARPRAYTPASEDRISEVAIMLPMDILAFHTGLLAASFANELSFNVQSNIPST